MGCSRFGDDKNGVGAGEGGEALKWVPDSATRASGMTFMGCSRFGDDKNGVGAGEGGEALKWVPDSATRASGMTFVRYSHFRDDVCGLFANSGCRNNSGRSCFHKKRPGLKYYLFQIAPRTDTCLSGTSSHR